MDFWNAVFSHLDDIGTVAISVLIFFMIATGVIVTRREANDLRADRDTWRAAAERERDARDKQDALLTKLTDQGAATLAALESIRRHADRG